MEELFIVSVLVKRDYRYSVFQLVPETVHSVVDYNDVSQGLAVLEDPQILDINSVFRTSAVLPVEPGADELPPRVKKVQNYVSISAVASCKNDHLEVLSSFFKAFDRVGSDINSCDGLLSIWKIDSNYVIYLLILEVLDTVDEGLI
jgi:hypothetical protein